MPNCISLMAASRIRSTLLACRSRFFQTSIPWWRSNPATVPESVHSKPVFGSPNQKFTLSGLFLKAASTLVIGEHDRGSIHATASATEFVSNGVRGKLLKAASLSAIAAAQILGGNVVLLLAGEGEGLGEAAREAQRVKGISEVITVESQDFSQSILAEPFTAVIISLLLSRSFTHVIVPSSASGKNFLPRAAALLSAPMVSDVIEIVDEETFVRPIYAGNAMATVKCSGGYPRFLSIRPTAFAPTHVEYAMESGHGSRPEISSFDVKSLLSSLPTLTSAPTKGPAAEKAMEAVGKSSWLGHELRKEDRPDLGSASVVVAGGRGVKSAENFKMIEALADKLGAAVGASRAAVDAGFVPNDLQVGQTGKVVAPQLYIAVGISGAIQHVAGMKDSKTIVAINKDAEAPIFQLADYGLVGDLFDIIPELTEKLPSKA